jgi:hypothetical protein
MLPAMFLDHCPVTAGMVRGHIETVAAGNLTGTKPQPKIA